MAFRTLFRHEPQIMHVIASELLKLLDIYLTGM